MHQRRRKTFGPLDPTSNQFEDAHAGQDEDASNSILDRVLVNVVFVRGMFPT
jgi:hypothetical protein